MTGHALQGEDGVGALQAHAGTGGTEGGFAGIRGFLDVSHVFMQLTHHQHDFLQPRRLLTLFAGKLVQITELALDVLQHAVMGRLLKQLACGFRFAFTYRNQAGVFPHLRQQSGQWLMAAGQAVENTNAVVEILKPMDIQPAQRCAPGLGIVLGVQRLQAGQQFGFIGLAEINIIPTAQHPGVNHGQFGDRSGFTKEPFFQSLQSPQRA